jgi:hypothetical protein
MNLNWWNQNKLKLSLLPAVIFWVVSALCFVFGLSFKNPIGFSMGGLDVSMWIAIGLSIGNTIIQIIGNDQGEKLNGIMLWGWLASYALGIGSNINTLLGVLRIDNIFLEWVVGLSLGSMIEIMPERLVVTFLKSLDFKKPKQEEVHRQKNIPYQKSNYQPKHKPIYVQRESPPFMQVHKDNEEFRPLNYK